MDLIDGCIYCESNECSSPGLLPSSNKGCFSESGWKSKEEYDFLVRRGISLREIYIVNSVYVSVSQSNLADDFDEEIWEFAAHEHFFYI